MEKGIEVVFKGVDRSPLTLEDATDWGWNPETVLIFQGAQPIAQFHSEDVFSVSATNCEASSYGK
jgi:hypothetical protein